MENLNDAEFGSDNSGEEAPILVAQRYLNIFRQVHIFNKAKRDEFDEELLSLPQNITDFFKRMPGGRLLVEHIEKVKTERGIAFVKANREDFDEGAGKTDTPTPVATGGVVQMAGGSITLDPSFAETLAQSLANAFKQLPATSPSSLQPGGNATVTADFGNAFDVIADEIRTSRASLLDVLKETRSITDSVIASQVSISRILEGILSSRTRDDNDVADLNSRIIASQASITKLLEGLYTANNKKNTEISDYLNVENRLQSFRNEIKDEISLSLQQMQDMFKEYAQTVNDRKVVIETVAQPFPADMEKAPNGSNFQQNIPPVYKKENTAEADTPNIKSSAIKPLSEDEKRIATTDIPAGMHARSDDDTPLHFEPVTNLGDEPILSSERTFGEEHSFGEERTFGEEHKKKRRKKKKNRENQTDVINSNPQQPFSPQISQAAQQPDAIISDKASAAPKHAENRTDNQRIPQAFGGTIRNTAYKYDDNFDHIRLDVPPLEENIFTEQPETEKDDLTARLNSLDNLHDETNTVGGYSTHTSNNITNDSIDDPILNHSVSFGSDDLDFVLPNGSQQNTAKSPARVNSNEEGNSLRNQNNDNSKERIASIDDLNGDDLDFALPDGIPEQDFSATEDFSAGFADISNEEPVNTNETSFSDDLNFSLPEKDFSLTEDEHDGQRNEAAVSSRQTVDVPEIPSDDLDFTLPENISSAEGIDALSQFMSQSLAKQQAQEENAGSSNFDEDVFHSLSQKNTDEENTGEDTLPFSKENADTESITAAPLPASDGISAFDTRQEILTPTNETEDLDSLLASDSTSADMLLNQDAVSSHPQHTDFEPQGILPQNETTSDDAADDTGTAASQQERPSRYSAELDKIRAALTADSVDISSLNEPIALDEYSDDENVGKDSDTLVTDKQVMSDSDDYSKASVHSSDDSDYIQSQQISSVAVSQSPSNVLDAAASGTVADTAQETAEDGEDWEWEYVDENGNEIPAGEDEDWEWEYVEDDGEEDKPDNNKQ